MTLHNSGENDQSAIVDITALPESRGLIGRFRDALSQFKRDIREPLPNTETLTRFSRIKVRTRHLFKRYGWKMFWGIVIFYLIRDSILYIIFPYLLAKQVIG